MTHPVSTHSIDAGARASWRATRPLPSISTSNCARQEGNLFFSPYSISTALAMTYAGARGVTEAQMAEALHFSLPQEALHPAFAELEAQLGAIQASGDVQLNVANALWPHVDYPFLDSFLDLVKVNYGVSLTAMDYRDPEAARQQINAWAEEQTNGKIQGSDPAGHHQYADPPGADECDLLQGQLGKPVRQGQDPGCGFHAAVRQAASPFR